jgi:lipoprotein-anchoring transpeptidase ErfK/SrfK
MTTLIRSSAIVLFLLCLLLIMNPSTLDREGKMENVTNTSQPQKGLVECKKPLEKLRRRFGLQTGEAALIVKVSEQELYLIKDERIVRSYPVSTSKYGTGNEEGSNKTPLGTHRIYKKVGEGVKIGTIFKACINTGRIAKVYHDTTDVEQDFVITRIMCLEGLEAGINKGEGIDSLERRIYLHGTPEEGLIGRPASHGCIRMKNDDVVELFDLVKIGTLVEIEK